MALFYKGVVLILLSSLMVTQLTIVLGYPTDVGYTYASVNNNLMVGGAKGANDMNSSPPPGVPPATDTEQMLQSAKDSTQTFKPEELSLMPPDLDPAFSLRPNHLAQKPNSPPGSTYSPSYPPGSIPNYLPGSKSNNPDDSDSKYSMENDIAHNGFQNGPPPHDQNGFPHGPPPHDHNPGSFNSHDQSGFNTHGPPKHTQDQSNSFYSFGSDKPPQVPGLFDFSVNSMGFPQQGNPIYPLNGNLYSTSNGNPQKPSNENQNDSQPRDLLNLKFGSLNLNGKLSQPNMGSPLGPYQSGSGNDPIGSSKLVQVKSEALGLDVDLQQPNIGLNNPQQSYPGNGGPNYSSDSSLITVDSDMMGVHAGVQQPNADLSYPGISTAKNPADPSLLGWKSETLEVTADIQQPIDV